MVMTADGQSQMTQILHTGVMFVSSEKIILDGVTHSATIRFILTRIISQSMNCTNETRIDATFHIFDTLYMLTNMPHCSDIYKRRGVFIEFAS